MAATYNSYTTGGSNVDWLAGPWVVDITINLIGTLARVTNADGSWTVFHGDLGGFTYNSSGGVDGTIRWITHTTSSDLGFIGATELEAVGGVGEHLNIEFSSWLSGGSTLYDLVFNRTGLVLNGDAGDNLLGGGIYSDVFNGGAGNDTVSYQRSAFSVGADLAGTTLGFGAGFGDTFNSIENLRGSNSIFGDTLFGNDSANRIDGLIGNDNLFGRGGNDTLNGGSGDDSLAGGAGNDTLNGGDGTDEISFADSSTSLYFQLSNTGNGTFNGPLSLGADTYTSIENVRGTQGNDTLWGNDSANVLYGEGGSDDLFGKLGNDTLFGGAGDDTLYGLEGDDTLHGETGIDTLDFTVGPMSSVTVIMDETGHGTATMEYYGTDTFDGMENVLGTNGNDTIIVGNDANLLQGNGGNDRIEGGGGNDTVEGGDGNDRLYGDANWGVQGGSAYLGDDVVLGGRGDDVLVGGLGNDWLEGGQGIDQITYADLIDDYGNGEYYIVADLSAGRVDKFFFDYYEGQPFSYGTDTIVGVESYEQFYGTSGGDSLTDSTATDLMHGGAGDDSFHPIADDARDWGYGEGGHDTVVYDHATSGITLSIYGVGLGESSGGGLGIYDYSGVEAVILTDFADVVRAGQGVLTGDDGIYGLDGNDSIEGGSGADHMEGGGGKDTLSYVTSTAGVRINLASGAASGGHADGDTFNGFENFFGSRFGDSVVGSRGRNVLTGGDGGDRLRGGAGSDIFAYTATTDSDPGVTAGTDFIIDFSRADGDRIDLRKIDAIAATIADNKFSFIGGADFTAAGQLRFYELGGNTIVEANVDTSLQADMSIQLKGIIALGLGDFIL